MITTSNEPEHCQMKLDGAAEHCSLGRLLLEVLKLCGDVLVVNVASARSFQNFVHNRFDIWILKNEKEKNECSGFGGFQNLVRMGLASLMINIANSKTEDVLVCVK